MKLVVRSPCPECTWRWLPRATFGDEAPYVALPHREPTATVETKEGRLGPAPFYPHPECARRHDAPRVAPVADALSPIKAIRVVGTAGDLHVRQAIADRPRPGPDRPFLAGCGVHEDAAIAERIAIVEAIERDCAHRAPRAAIVDGETSDLEVCEGIPRTHGGPFVVAHVVDSGALRLLPLEFVELASRSSRPHPLVTADSTGIAVHDSVEQAIAAGTREVAERIALDHFLGQPRGVAWDLDTLPVAERVRLRFVAALGWSVTVFPMRPALGHVACLVTLVRSDALRATRWGAGAGRTSAQALRRATLEAVGQVLVGGGASDVRPLTIERTVAFTGTTEPHGAALTRDAERVVVDRGNRMTDALDLHARHVIVPALFPPRVS